MDQDRLSLLALHFIPGLGDYLIRQLISYCGSAEKVFRMPKGKLIQVPGIGRVTADAIRKGKAFQLAEREIRKTERSGARIVFFTDREYPTRLRQIADAPTLLFLKGSFDLENHYSVAIVGTRQATSYGRSCVDQLVQGLVPFQALIISGLAYGIDIHAHKQSLKNGLPTVGVMGSGLDVIYPGAHRDTALRMMENGGLITEHPFGTQPEAHNFPARNRIVAGLADAVVIVEAAERGGALITAEIANSYNRDVFAFPGNIGQSHSAGCNNLIKSNKAHLITGVNDLIYIMNWSVGEAPSKKIPFDFAQYNPDEQSVLRILLENNRQLMIDDLSWRTGIPVSRLASVLLTLEFKGVVSPLPGKVFRLVAN